MRVASNIFFSIAIKYEMIFLSKGEPGAQLYERFNNRLQYGHSKSKHSHKEEFRNHNIALEIPAKVYHARSCPNSVSE